MKDFFSERDTKDRRKEILRAKRFKERMGGFVNAPEQQAVDNTYFNVMSYHESKTKDAVENRMTEGLLDRIADTANTTRRNTVSGRTWFVRPGGLPVGLGTSASEFQLLSLGLIAADPTGGDIVLLRPGQYNEPMTISKPIVLLSTRAGSATIGR
jgi:hypothetical protein